MKNVIKLTLVLALAISALWFVPAGQPENVSAYLGWVGADGSPYFGGTLPQPFDINVSNDGGISVSGFDRDLVLDAYNDPHIAWFSNSASGSQELFVYYVHWDDTQQTWLCANGDDYAVTPGSARVGTRTADVDDDYASLSLALDSNRRPHLAISGVDNGDGDIVYVRWNGTAWVSLDGVDYLTNPDAANVTDSANFTGGGQPVMQGIDAFPSLALDAENNPNLAWQHDSDDNAVNRSWEIYFIHTVQNQTIWRSSGANGFQFWLKSHYDKCRVSNNDGDSIYPSMVLSFNDPLDTAGLGMPHIAWQDDTWNGNEEIAYLLWHGDENGGNTSPWYCVDGSAYDPSIAVNPVNVSRNTGDSNNPSLVVDSSNSPLIAWEDETNAVNGNMDIFFSRWSTTNTDWICADGTLYNPVANPNPVNVTRNVGDSVEVSLDMDSSEEPHIVWCDDSYTSTYSDFNLFYMGWDGSNWLYADTTSYDETEDPNHCNVSENDYFSWAPCLVIDSTDVPHIAWTDETGAGLPGPLPFSTPTGGEYETQDWNDDYSGWSTSEVYYVTWENSFDGVLSLEKSVDSDNDGLFDDDGELVVSNGTLTYQVDYEYVSGNDPVLDGYIYDSVPDGTYYIGGSMSPIYEYSTDNGVTWIPGEAPDGSPGGTMFRWALDTNNGWSPLTILFSVRIINPPLAWVFCNTASLDHLQIEDPMESNTVCNTLDYQFTGTFEVSKNVDVDGDGFYEDSGYPVERGEALCYELEWSFDNPNNDPLAAAYLYDVIPENTTYLAGAIPEYNLSYSVDGGTTWLSGEPTVGTASGTILRWGPLPSGWVGADDSQYIGSMVSQPMDIDVSRSLTNSYTDEDRFLALDSNNYPHIAWRERLPTDEDIYYVRWDGSNWVTANGSVYDPLTENANISRTTAESRSPSFALDSNDLPHISWRELDPQVTGGGYDIVYIKFDGTNWVCADGTVYDPTTTNSNVSDNDGSSQHPSLVLDSNDNPCIAWYDWDPPTINGNEYDIYFVRHDGTDWVNADGTNYAANHAGANVSYNPGISAMVRLAVDNNDNPHLVWHDTTTAITGGDFDVLYVRWDVNQWECANGSPYTATESDANVSNNNGGSNNHPAIEIDSNNLPHIAWFDNESTAVNGLEDIYYVHWAGNAWLAADGTPYSTDHASANVSRNDGRSYRPSLALDSNDIPHLAWYDETASIIFGTGSDVLYVSWNGTNWVSASGDNYSPANSTSNVSVDDGGTLLTCLTLDSYDEPHLVWEEFSNGSYQVTYVHWAPVERTFNFCVEVADFDCWDNDGEPIIRSITNRAYFTHAFGTAPQYTNYVINPVKFCPVPDEEKAELAIEKTAQKLQYKLGDVAVFNVTVSNTGNIDVTDVALSDVFPRELVYLSSKPEGSSSINGWKYNIGTLRAGESRHFQFRFRIDPAIKLGESPLVIENIATVTCNELDALTDSAVITVYKNIVTEQINLVVVWTGIDIETSQGESGSEITLDMVASGGSSPYEIYIDWGNEDETVISEVVREASTTYTYNSSGEYKVVIKLVDRFGKTKYVERVLYID